MNIVTVTPTRNNRPLFLEHMKWQMSKQTLQPTHMVIVDDEPVLKTKDITWRYKIGLKRAAELGADLIVIIEDDDWYSENYIETMVTLWTQHGKPDLFGLNSTIYYNLQGKKWTPIFHPGRSSMFNSIMTPKILEYDLGPDDYSFTDITIWNLPITKCSATFEPLICLGIKHGQGLTGGVGHDQNWPCFKAHDKDLSWLESRVDQTSFEFYKQFTHGN